MVIGNGDIASVLPESDLLFFASGVSNSQETRKAEYYREMKLLSSMDKTKHIVYFSSLGVLNRETRYYQHKRTMEVLVKRYFPSHTIIRIGNISWGKNPNTLINYLKAHPEAEIRDEYRHIVDKDEFLYWINLIPDWSCEMNITGKFLTVQEVYDEYVELRR